jgi:hypothetical protein
MVGLLGRVIISSQGLYLHRTTQHRTMRTNIHALSGIRTHNPSNQPAKTHASDRTTTVTSEIELPLDNKMLSHGTLPETVIVVQQTKSSRVIVF